MSPEISTMVKEIIATLSQRGETLATAESITAGGLSQEITSIEGASQIFLGAIVSYSNEAKISVLGIEKNLIDAHTVYSQEVAIAMAHAVREKFGSTWAIATTGVAGPGSSDGVAPGRVWVAIVGPKSSVMELSLEGARESVRNAAVATAISAFTRILR
jgi:nicotinamide-nucleotide amidase